MRKGKILTAVILIGVAALSLSGCTKRELEDRYFPLAVELHRMEEGYRIEYALPDMAGETGQKKGQDQERKEEEEDTKEEMAVSPTPKEAAMEYAACVDKYMDTGHTKAVILESEILGNQDVRKEVLSYFEDEVSYARNTLVFLYELEGAGSMIHQTASSVDSLGTYLEDLMENDPDRKTLKRVTLGDVLNFWHNQDNEIQIPRLQVKNGKPILEGDILIQNVDKTD